MTSCKLGLFLKECTYYGIAEVTIRKFKHVGELRKEETKIIR